MHQAVKECPLLKIGENFGVMRYEWEYSGATRRGDSHDPWVHRGVVITQEDAHLSNVLVKQYRYFALIGMRIANSEPV